MLISEEYRALNRDLHERKAKWGLAAQAHAPAVAVFAKRVGVTELLDYGCGKERLKEALAPEGFVVRGYDPAIPGLDSPPEPAELVVCLDVLEHIEPECLEDVLFDLKRVTKRVGLFSVCTRASVRKLADGSNPHRIIENEAWWMERLRRHFKADVIQSDPPEQFIVVVKPK